MDQPAPIHRKVQVQIGVVPNASLPQIKQLCRRLHLVIFMRVIEPTRPDAHIAFRGNPRLAVLVALGQTLATRRIVRTATVALHLEHRPIGFAGPAVLISHPTNIRAHITKDHRIRLALAHGALKAWEVVDLFLAVGALAARAVKPDFVHWPVVGEHLAELLAEILVVCLAGSVRRIVAVPRREVDAKLEPRLATCVAQLPQNVARAVFPGARLHRMRTHGRWPIAEAIMVLGGDDHAGDASRFHHAYPLSRIKRGGCERGGRFVAVPPLAVREGVWSKVDEPREFHVLPCPLRRRRCWCNRWKRRGGFINHGNDGKQSKGKGGWVHDISLASNLRAE